MANNKNVTKQKAEILREPNIISTYVLDEPVEWAGEKIYQLEFRALRAKDLMQVQKQKDVSNIEAVAQLLQLSTLADPYVIENLSIKDFMEAGKVLNDFLLKDLMG